MTDHIPEHQEEMQQVDDSGRYLFSYQTFESAAPKGKQRGSPSPRRVPDAQEAKPSPLRDRVHVHDQALDSKNFKMSDRQQ